MAEAFGQDATQAPHPTQAAASMASSTSNRYGVGILCTARIHRNVPPGLDDFIQRAAVYDQIFDHFKDPGPEGFHHNRIPIVEGAHVQLTDSHPLALTMRYAIDHGPAGTANSLATVVVEFDRFLVVENQLLIQSIQHFQKRHVGIHVCGRNGFKPPPFLRSCLAPDFQSEVDIFNFTHYL
jgi:hypothetical protein